MGQRKGKITGFSPHGKREFQDICAAFLAEKSTFLEKNEPSPDVGLILDTAIEFTMKAKSMKIKDLELVGGSTCLHSLGKEASQFSVPFFSCPFMSFMLHGDFFLVFTI
jgi:hypothetical protein